MKERVEVTQSQLGTYLKIQINSEEITKKKQLNKSEKKASKSCTHTRTSSNTTCPHLHNRKQEVGDRLTLDNQLVEKTHQRKTQQEAKTKHIHRANRNHSPRSVR